ncbi:hypothetical protein PUN28_004761 [Cardiocondyla obscurior]|uniref:Uncharacterized protein n=1 Tax=Cardiocondyla obscurior TaxID=286306 RepID=A0AAW2GII9_9HYME
MISSSPSTKSDAFIIAIMTELNYLATVNTSPAMPPGKMDAVNNECETIAMNCAVCENAKVIIFKTRPFFSRDNLFSCCSQQWACNIVRSSSKRTCFRRTVELTLRKYRIRAASSYMQRNYCRSRTVRLAQMKKLSISPKILDYLIDAHDKFRTNNARNIGSGVPAPARFLADNFPQECSNRDCCATCSITYNTRSTRARTYTAYFPLRVSAK